MAAEAVVEEEFCGAMAAVAEYWPAAKALAEALTPSEKPGVVPLVVPVAAVVVSQLPPVPG